MDLNLLGLGVLAQRQDHGQHAGFVLGLDLLRVDCRRQRERSSERAIASLNAMELLMVDCVVELLLATQSERVFFNRQVDLLFLHVR